MTKFFTSDLHFSHKNICKFTDRSTVVSQEQHDEWLVDLWNSQVKKSDEIWHLGDFWLGSDYTQLATLVKRLNGQKFFIKGNHDHEKNLKKLKDDNLIQMYYQYKEIKILDTPACLFHFPITSWHKQHYGSIHLHGHCLDTETEILTDQGFRSKTTLEKSDKIATFNLNTRAIEYQTYSEFHEYSGVHDMVAYEGKSTSLAVTDKHRVVVKKEENYGIKIADTLNGSVVIPVCGENTKQDYPISDDLLRLYLHITTDGSFENSNLVRFHFKKERKIKELESLLTRLKIKYSINPSNTGTFKINFSLPDTLRGFNIKPLDRDLIINLSSRQVNILVETYAITDGCRTGKHSYRFSTSKESEANLLQEVLVTSGYCCNLLKRVRGKYVGYILSVNTRKDSTINAKTTKYKINGEVWCVTVPNSTLVVRRKGKCHITGNCHGTLAPQQGKILDVGIDNAYKLSGEHKFFTEKDVVEYMENISIRINDHHKQND